MSDNIIKHLSFGDEARENVFNGIDKLYLAVSSTLGASGKCVLLEDDSGSPVVTKDGVTVANAVTLIDPVENMVQPYSSRPQGRRWRRLVTGQPPPLY